MFDLELLLQALNRSVSDATEASSVLKPRRSYFGGSKYVEKYLFAVRRTIQALRCSKL